MVYRVVGGSGPRVWSVDGLRERLRSGPWLRGAHWDGGLLFPGRPRGRAFDLLLTPQRGILRRGNESLVLPWSQHQPLARSQSTAEGWCLASWDGKGGGGVAVHLQGHLEEEALRRLPWMRSMSARFNRTNVGGSYIPLHRCVWERRADKDVCEVLFEVLASREQARLRLSDREAVDALLRRIVTTEHRARYETHGARRETIAVISALNELGFRHQLGGRPLPGEIIQDEGRVLAAVMKASESSPFNQDVAVDASNARRLIEARYAAVPPWPFEPLLDIADDQ